MQRRVFLLVVLFVVLAAFYAKVSSEGVPVITMQQQSQTEMFNQIDEIAMEQAETTSTSSKN